MSKEMNSPQVNKGEGMYREMARKLLTNFNAGALVDDIEQALLKVAAQARLAAIEECAAEVVKWVNTFNWNEHQHALCDAQRRIRALSAPQMQQSEVKGSKGEL